MIAEILSVGTELLMGQIANTDAQYISRRLSELGVTLYRHTTVGDNPARVKEALGDQVKEVRISSILKSGACCLTADGPVSLEMEKYMNKVEGGAHMKADRVLELNADSAPFAALKQAVEADDKDTVTKYAKLLYGQALLLAGLPLEDPAEYAQLVCSLMV